MGRYGSLGWSLVRPARSSRSVGWSTRRFTDGWRSSPCRKSASSVNLLSTGEWPNPSIPKYYKTLQNKLLCFIKVRITLVHSARPRELKTHQGIPPCFPLFGSPRHYSQSTPHHYSQSTFYKNMVLELNRPQRAFYHYSTLVATLELPTIVLSAPTPDGSIPQLL